MDSFYEMLQKFNALGECNGARHERNERPVPFVLSRSNEACPKTRPRVCRHTDQLGNIDRDSDLLGTILH